MFGSGIGSYQAAQNEHMTRELTSFHPLNYEAKCLYLTVAVEMGATGLLALLYAMYRYSILISANIDHPDSAGDGALACLVHAPVVSLVVASFCDTPLFDPLRCETTLLLAVLLGAICVAAMPRRQHAPARAHPR